MKMAEDFDRCQKCGQGWFEKKERVLVEKNSPLQWSKPLFYKVEVDLVCVDCGHTQYKYTEE